MQAHEAQLGRLKKALNIESDTAFSQILDVSQGSVSGAKKRGQIPHSWFFQVSEKTGVSVDWLFSGRGSMRMGEHVETPQTTCVEPTLSTCPHCVKHGEKLTLVEEEHQRINRAFIESLQKNLKLSEENGQLRLDNLKMAQRLDTAEAMCQQYAKVIKEIGVPDPLFDERQNIPFNESL